MITFDSKAHIYYNDGAKIFSVTQILKGAGLLDFSMIPPAILKRASNFGTAVHMATSLHDKHILDAEKLDSALVPYLEAQIKFMHDTDAEILLNEEHLYSKKYNFVGTPDRALRINSRIKIVDYKSGNTFNQTTSLQLAGYKVLYNEGKKVIDKAKDRIAVHLLGDATYKIEPCEDKSDESVFFAALSIHNWRLRHDNN